MTGKRLLWVGIACLVLLLVGCQGKRADMETVGEMNETSLMEEEAAEKICLDGFGAALEMREAKKVIALTVTLGRIWQLAGGELAAVAVDAGQVPPQLMGAAEVLEEREALNVQQLLRLSPDLILLSAQRQEHGEMKQSLAQRDVAAVYFSLTHFPDYLKALDICTDLTGRKDLYEEYGQKLEVEINSIIVKNRREDKPVVVLISVSSEGGSVINSHSMTGRILAELGCVNASDGNRSLQGPLQIKPLLKVNPDYIFLVPEGDIKEDQLCEAAESIQGKAVFRVLRAMEKENFYVLPKELFGDQPNEKWAGSYAYLAELLS